LNVRVVGRGISGTEMPVTYLRIAPSPDSTAQLRAGLENWSGIASSRGLARVGSASCRSSARCNTCLAFGMWERRGPSSIRVFPPLVKWRCGLVTRSTSSRLDPWTERVRQVDRPPDRVLRAVFASPFAVAGFDDDRFFRRAHHQRMGAQAMRFFRRACIFCPRIRGDTQTWRHRPQK